MKQLAFYHLVPPPRNKDLEAAFVADVPDNVLLTEDLLWFELPAESDELIVKRP